MSTHDNPGIDPFRHCGVGMYLGGMTPRPMHGEFDAVLTIGALPSGAEDEGIKHRYIQFTDADLEDHPERVTTAISWVFSQVAHQRKVLVRSHGGRQRPGLVIAGVCMRLGGTYADAVACVRQGHPDALTDPRHLDFLKSLEPSL